MTNNSIPHMHHQCQGIVSSLPSTLRDCTRWVVWRYETRDGKQTKVPKRPNGWPARVNDPTTWSALSDVLDALGTGRFDGFGIVLGDGLAGIDLDWKHYDSTGIPDAAQSIIERFTTYAELSPSGRGAHILLFATLPAGARNRSTIVPGVEIEIYDRNRYFTVTGKRLTPYDITDQQDQLNDVLAELGMVTTPQPASAEQPSRSVDISDAELLDRMFKSGSGPALQRLWAGDWSTYPSQSEADLAMASHLLWWCNGDTERADRMFRQSGLYRPKWDERHRSDGSTYGQATLERARNGLNGGYTPPSHARGAAQPPPKHPLDGLVGEDTVDGLPRYVVRDGVIHAARVDGRGESRTVSYTRLANFAAVITREVHATDGVGEDTLFELEGYLEDGTALPRIIVPAAEFARMDWPLRLWGARAIVTPGRGVTDTLRSAIQHLSIGRTEHATLYKHLGWVRIGERWVYLHAGGGITAGEPVQVDVDPGRILDGFRLPPPPTADDEQQRINQLVALLHLAPHHVTMPLFLYALAAPLGHTPFSLYMAGPTGVRKTSLALVYQSMWGYRSTIPPIGWEATANALEGVAFGAKDALLVIDDYAPTGHARSQQELQAKGARLLRNQGNATGRLRMRADGSMGGDRPPRGSLLITGEDLPPGHSVRARTLVIDIRRDDVRLDALSKAQRLARDGVYAEGMAAWIAYLAADLDHHRERLDERLEELRPQWSADHGRTTDALARLQAVWEMYMAYAASRGVDLSSITPLVVAALTHLRDAQADAVREEDPAARFITLLYAAIRMGRAHIEPLEFCGEDNVATMFPDPNLWGWTYNQMKCLWEAQGPRIGWLPPTSPTSEQVLYLDPSPAWAVVNRLAAENGQPLPSERTVWRLLAQQNLLLAEEEGGKVRFQVRVRVRGQRIYVVRLRLHTAP